MIVSFVLNGERRTLEADPFDRASRILAEVCGLESVKTSCGIGRCGACTILVDGEAANACLLVAARMDGADIVTADGLGARADALVAALQAEGAIQCGYCAPGLLVSLVALQARGEAPDRQELETVLAGNLCRCSGYAGLRRAVLGLAGRKWDRIA
jgi:aerobic-type carbon monoxide dehydrogenase small subunit (CoxS/CutS family)